MSPQQAMYVTSELARRRKSPIAVWLLWLFLGGLGAHNFYLGRTGRGIAQVVLFVLGWATAAIVIGLVLLAVLYGWVIVEAFGLRNAIQAADARVEREILSSVGR